MYSNCIAVAADRMNVDLSRIPVHRGACHESHLDSIIRGELGRWAALVSGLVILGFHSFFALLASKHVAVSRRPVRTAASHESQVNRSIRGALGGWAALEAVQLDSTPYERLISCFFIENCKVNTVMFYVASSFVPAGRCKPP